VGFEPSSEKTRQKRGKMKLSIEAKVAAAVAAAFIALMLGAIAQGNGGNQAGEPDGYDATENPRVNTYVLQQGF
jgi:hypothetical protein